MTASTILSRRPPSSFPPSHMAFTSTWRKNQHILNCSTVQHKVPQKPSNKHLHVHRTPNKELKVKVDVSVVCTFGGTSLNTRSPAALNGIYWCTVIPSYLPRRPSCRPGPWWWRWSGKAVQSPELLLVAPTQRPQRPLLCQAAATWWEDWWRDLIFAVLGEFAIISSVEQNESATQIHEQEMMVYIRRGGNYLASLPPGVLALQPMKSYRKSCSLALLIRGISPLRTFWIVGISTSRPRLKMWLCVVKTCRTNKTNAFWLLKDSTIVSVVLQVLHVPLVLQPVQFSCQLSQCQSSDLWHSAPLWSI